MLILYHRGIVRFNSYFDLVKHFLVCQRMSDLPEGIMCLKNCSRDGGSSNKVLYMILKSSNKYIYDVQLKI